MESSISQQGVGLPYTNNDTQSSNNLCQLSDVRFHELSICNKCWVAITISWSQKVEDSKHNESILFSESQFCNISNIRISQLCNIILLHFNSNWGVATKLHPYHSHSLSIYNCVCGWWKLINFVKIIFSMVLAQILMNIIFILI